MKKLSHKYGYDELYQIVDKFSSERPDIGQIVEEYSNEEKIDSEKEEEIMKHLDICLKNKCMLDFPIESLNGILNSPKRVLNDHHLLFNFIKQVIEKHKKKSSININKDNDEKTNENDDENLQLLMCSLDYRQMSKEEMKEIFESDFLSSVFEIRGSKEMMKTLLTDNDQKEERISKLETKIGELENQLKEFKLINEKQNQENQNQLKLLNDQTRNQLEKMLENQIKEFKLVYEKQNQENQNQLKLLNDQAQNQLEKIIEYQNKIDKQQKIIDDQAIQIKKHEETVDVISKNLSKLIEEQEKSFKELEEKMIAYSKEQEKQNKIIQAHETIVKEISKLIGSITISVQQDQTIKAIIDIKEEGAKLDIKNSKYILNSNPETKLGKSSYQNGFPIDKLRQEILFKKVAGTYYLHVLLVDNFGHEEEYISQKVITNGAILTFDFKGKVDSVTLDAGKYKLEVWGAEGGKCNKYIKTPGKGGYSYGTLSLQSKTKLFIHVGECPNNKKGGWNGGGSGGDSGFLRSPGGGGSTDISLYGEEGSNNWNKQDHLYSRIIVAGGGGGSSFDENPNWYGGFGGGLSGQCSGRGPSENEGTQTRAGKKGENSLGQGFGIGGNSNIYVSSGGGGGWYGGGSPDVDGGGSGGSGYVYNSLTASNYPSGCKLDKSFYLTDSKTISGDQNFPNPRSSTTEKGHSGHGYAKITFL